MDKLTERLRGYCQEWEAYRREKYRHDLEDAATAIETLRADLARVTAERDAAVADMEALMWFSGEGCRICAHAVEVHKEPYVRLDCDREKGTDCSPKWRGIVEMDTYYGFTAAVQFGVDHAIQCIKEAPAADVAPVVHETPMLRYRPERYERYDEYGVNENGEMLYVKRVFVDEKSYAMYCPACGKRLCSRFINFCPNCGAKMDGSEKSTD